MNAIEYEMKAANSNNLNIVFHVGLFLLLLDAVFILIVYVLTHLLLVLDPQ